MIRTCFPKTTVTGIMILVTLIVPRGVYGQRRGQEEAPPQRWSPISVGLYVGYDNQPSGEVAGAQIRIPVLRSGTVQLISGANVTFLNRLKEYQFNVEAVYTTVASTGGLYAGGGLAWRNTMFGSDLTAGRRTVQGYSIVVGFETGRIAGTSLSPQVEIRWSFLKETALNPRVISLGVNFPLWRAGPRGSDLATR